MKKMMFGLLYVVLGLLVFGLLYLAADAIGSRLAVNQDQSKQQDRHIQAFILSNGVHTDIVLPAKSGLQDWTHVFPLENNKDKAARPAYIAIGWGDKGFYLNTPEWKDLTAKTALVAALGIGETALHITYYQDLKPDSLCREIWINDSQFNALKDFILNSLDKDDQGNPIYIDTNAQYGDHDAFYEAKGSYSMFYSCNTWSNQALKHAQMPAARWTVFDTGILRHYR